jgi:hypothetical protein
MVKRVRWALLAFIIAIGTVQPSGVFAQAKGDTLDPAPQGSFSIVVIPDTQGYKGKGTIAQPDSGQEASNPVFEAHTRWIVDNMKTQRIVFVSHTGDIVDRNNNDQWGLARKCMDRLHGRIPYGIAPGNHDMKHDDGDTSLFQRYFPASRFTDFPWYGGYYPGVPGKPNISGNNANSFQLFTAEGIDFIILHLECNAPDDVLGWVDGVLDKYPDRWAIVATHMDLGPIREPTANEGFFKDPKGKMQWSKVHGPRGNSPQQMWDKCFRKHRNLIIIFSGDQSRTTAMYLTFTGDYGNTVHSLMSDYTSSGPLRLYRFLPQEKTIRVITYDTTHNRLVDSTSYVPDRKNHQFTISLDLISRKPSSAERQNRPKEKK